MERKKEDDFIYILTGKYSLLKDITELPTEKDIELDIGCGKGGFTAQLAKKYPERIIIGADVMIGRLRKLVKKIQRKELQNIIPLRVEARSLIYYMLPDESLSRIHVLCPDPWPKTRHRHQRLLSSEFTGRIKRILKTGGVFHFSTDDRTYFETALEITEKSGLFTRDDTAIEDINNIKTDFEKRWNNQGKEVYHSAWIKNNP